jgi:purine-binding chemotaxis protein CheW
VSEDGRPPSEQLRAFIGASLEESKPAMQVPTDVTLSFLMFRHGGRWFGVRAEAVKLVVAKDSITRVPAQPPHVLGVALIRSRLIPVIDLAHMTRSADRPADDAPGLRLVVLASQDDEVALVADEARGVIELAANSIDHNTSNKVSFISGVVKWRKGTASVIDTGLLLRAATRGEGDA